MKIEGNQDIRAVVDTVAEEAVVRYKESREFQQMMVDHQNVLLLLQKTQSDLESSRNLFQEKLDNQERLMTAGFNLEKSSWAIKHFDELSPKNGKTYEENEQQFLNDMKSKELEIKLLHGRIQDLIEKKTGQAKDMAPHLRKKISKKFIENFQILRHEIQHDIEHAVNLLSDATKHQQQIQQYSQDFEKVMAPKIHEDFFQSDRPFIQVSEFKHLLAETSQKQLKLREHSCDTEKIIGMSIRQKLDNIAESFNKAAASLERDLQQVFE